MEKWRERTAQSKMASTPRWLGVQDGLESKPVLVGPMRHGPGLYCTVLLGLVRACVGLRSDRFFGAHAFTKKGFLPRQASRSPALPLFFFFLALWFDLLWFPALPLSRSSTVCVCVYSLPSSLSVSVSVCTVAPNLHFLLPVAKNHDLQQHSSCRSPGQVSLFPPGQSSRNLVESTH